MKLVGAISEPLFNTGRGQQLRSHIMSLLNTVLMPLLGIVVFLMLWSVVAKQIDTSLGQFPGPAAVYEQAVNLVEEHHREREKEEAFYERVEEYNAKRLADDPSYEPRQRDYTGKPTFFDQIGTSLVTVMCGFLLASILAIPLGIIIGLSQNLHAAFNPLIQVFKPVSPLAWLPLVTMVVSAVYVTNDPMIPKSFLTSMFTVTLCCLWPTIQNTAVGVAGVSKDLENVGRVLQLSWLRYVRRIVLPSAIPLIFTGLRVSLGIAWMVLIAAEMLAQNPGLGKFVWDEFQNGSSDSLSRIMVAVIVIGFIGFMLDRIMLMIQRLVSWDKSATIR